MRVKSIIVVVFYSLLFCVGSVGARIEVEEFRRVLAKLNNGKEYVFMDMNLSEADKEFLKDLEVTPPLNERFGLEFNYQGSLSFEDLEKSDPNSKYNKLRNALIDFFSRTTNADQIRNNGTGIIADMMLDYVGSLKESYGSKFVFLSLKAFHPSDLFLNFPRWHFDGDSDASTTEASVNFAGTFKGEPTVFTKITSDELEKFNKKYNELTRIRNNKTPVDISGLRRRIALFTESQESDVVKRNLQKELNRLATWENEGVSLDSWNLLKLNYRFRLHKFMSHQLSYSIETPEPFQAALFTITGKKSALHSEPYIEKNRMFFSVRLYTHMKNEVRNGEPQILSMDDPATS